MKTNPEDKTIIVPTLGAVAETLTRETAAEAVGYAMSVCRCRSTSPLGQRYLQKDARDLEEAAGFGNSVAGEELPVCLAVSETRKDAQWVWTARELDVR